MESNFGRSSGNATGHSGAYVRFEPYLSAYTNLNATFTKKKKGALYDRSSTAFVVDK